MFLVDSPTKILSFTKSVSPFIAGHDLLHLTYNFHLDSSPAHTIVRRNLKRFVGADFLDTLSSLLPGVHESSISSLSSANHLDSLVNGISSAISTALDTHAPKTEWVVKKRIAPWLTEALRTKIRHRNKLYTQARRSKDVLSMAEYRHYRNFLSLELRAARDNFYCSRLSSLSGPSSIWKELASLHLTKPRASSPFSFFSPDQLNVFYSSISRLNAPYPASLSSLILPPLSPNQPVSKFTEITTESLHSVLAVTNLRSLSQGPDSLSNFAISESLPFLSNIILDIFNCSLRLSHFPSLWKRAFIRPLLKVVPPAAPSDTRPVANLSELSKALERIVFNEVTSFLTSNNLVDPFQSGFRKGFSTQTALLKLNQDIRRAVDDRKLTILVLFDFSKAFDTVPHDKLLIKLRLLGCSEGPLAWFFSYLSNRTQAVVDDRGILSTWQNTNIGVPQGSVLGPLLFSLFIRDIGAGLRHSQYLTYADDTQIYLSCYPSQLAHALSDVTQDVEYISDYASNNGLKLNLVKSKVIILGSGAYINRIDFAVLPRIRVNSTDLPFVNHVRNLGLIMQSNLSWHNHVLNISNRVNFILFRLKHNKNLLSQRLRTILICSLIFPVIDYCCLVYNDLTGEQNLILKRLINNCIRFIFNLRRDVHISAYRNNLSWLTVANRRKYFMGIFIFKLLRSTTSSYISNLFTPAPPSNRPSRHAVPLTFSIPVHRTSTLHRSFVLSASYYWHSLPTRISSLPTLSSFKDALREHLLLSQRC